MLYKDLGCGQSC